MGDKLSLKLVDRRHPNPVAQIYDSDHIQTIWIGRRDDMDFIIDDDTVSRVHCSIRYDGNNRWFLSDNNSTHGTLFNGLFVMPGAEERIKGFGDTVLVGLNGCGFFAEQPTETQGGDLSEPEEAPPTLAGDELREAVKDMMTIFDEPKQSKDPWYAELAKVIVKGPEGCPQWLWWMILAGCGLFYAWIKHRN